MELAFVGGILFVLLIAFMGYKVMESRKKKGSKGSGGGAGGGDVHIK